MMSTRSSYYRRRFRWKRWLVNAALLAMVLVTIWALWPRGMDAANWGKNATFTRLSCEQDATTRTDVQQLCALQVIPNNSQPPRDYRRDYFGEAWADVDGNGCQTRNDILARDLRGVVKRRDNCVVESGTLDDPYTGKTIHFQHGAQTSAQVQIDHVVALAAAWRAGAWQWDDQRRLQYANDPLVLLAVDGPANQEKGSKDADQWLPENPAYVCPYARRQIAIKTKYTLAVRPTEKVALLKALGTCPAE